MAFQVPQALPQRQVAPLHRLSVSRPIPSQQPLDQSQEWVLFSPGQTQELFTPTAETPGTVGPSRLSDFGSLNSIVPPSPEQDEAAHDADDLDSLDDGLHEFREPILLRQIDHSGGTILPAHDGLGGFHASSPPVQEQIWQHERYNPRRRPLLHSRSTSSVFKRLDKIDDEPEKEHPFVEGDKLDRIEKWRLDQSRVMLEEVQKETRRRRRLSLTNPLSPQSIPAAIRTEHVLEPNVPLSARASARSAAESETFWERITRRVIKDFMGIDDNILSVILGESLVEEEAIEEEGDLSTTPKAINNVTLPKRLGGVEEEERLGAGWEDRLLRRLAKELNTIVHNLSDQADPISPRLEPQNFEYAGIPIKPRNHPPIPEQDVLDLGKTPKASENTSALFGPTLQRADEQEAAAAEHAAGWGIEDSKPAEGADHDEAELEYWERTPDLKQVFAYLSRRLLKRGPQGPASFLDMEASSPFSPSTSHVPAPTPASSRPGIATSSTPDSLRRAAIIQQHHPLVSRAHEARMAKQRNAAASQKQQQQNQHSHQQLHQRRPSMRSIAELMSSSRPQTAAAAVAAASECGRDTISGSLKRAGADCASQSTKRSRTASHRRYWDLGSDSAAAALGGMGIWGEV